jgi:GH25 family lysozyme M1 (1,4-beta-N-acetylmuramidase)
MELPKNTKVINRTGRSPIIYTDVYFWEDSLENPDVAGLGSPDLWFAHWGTGFPPTPDSWSNWEIWQYSTTGSVDGITGYVNLWCIR